MLLCQKTGQLVHSLLYVVMGSPTYFSSRMLNTTVHLAQNIENETAIWHVKATVGSITNFAWACELDFRETAA